MFFTLAVRFANAACTANGTGDRLEVQLVQLSERRVPLGIMAAKLRTTSDTPQSLQYYGIKGIQEGSHYAKRP